MWYKNRTMRAHSLQAGACEPDREGGNQHTDYIEWAASQNILVFVSVQRFRSRPETSISFASTIIRPYIDSSSAHKCHSGQRVCEERRSSKLLLSKRVALSVGGSSSSSQCCIFYKNALPFVVPMRTQTAAVQLVYMCVTQISKREKKNKRFYQRENQQMKTDSDFSVECCVWVEIN